MTIDRSILGQACPHIVGIVANLLSLEGNIAPAEMKARLSKLSHNNVVTLKGV